MKNLRTSKKASIKRASALARQRMNRFDRQTLDRVTAIYRNAADDINRTILSYGDANGNLRIEVLQQLLTQSRQRLDELRQARDQLLNESLTRAAAIGVQPFAPVLPSGALTRIADEAVQFSVNFIAADGLQLSDRIWRVDNHARQIIEDSISSAVVQGHSASQAASDLLARGQPVPASLRDKTNMANASRVGNVVSRELTRSGSPRANALRLFRTELNRAHGEAYMAGGEDVPGFAGWKFLLSPRHPETDICDMHARANIYGLGPGVYPSRKRTPWPAHPNTLSYTEIVFEDEITDEDRAGKTTRLEWLRGQRPGIQQRVLNSRKKAAALQQGLLRENEITTPWQVLKKRYTRRGIDVDGLTPAAPPKPKATGETLITGIDADAFSEYRDQAFRYAPKNVQQLIKQVRQPAHIEVVKSGTSYYQGDKIRLAKTSMTERAGFHSRYDVYRHEYGHFVDYWVKPQKGRPRAISSRPASQGGLQDVIDRTRKKLRSQSAREVARRQRIRDELLQLEDTNLADLFGALTNNRLGWGHSVSYLQKPGFRQTEIFANLFDAYSRQDPSAWNYIQAELPELAAEFVNLINRETKS